MFVYFASGCKLWYELSVGSAANSREELCCFSRALLPPRAVNVEVHARGLLQPNNVSKGLYILVQSQCPPKGFSPESYLTSPARWVRDVARACNGIYIGLGQHFAIFHFILWVRELLFYILKCIIICMYTKKKKCSQRLHRKKKAHHLFCCLINSKCEEGSRVSALGEDVNSKVVTLKICLGI